MAAYPYNPQNYTPAPYNGYQQAMNGAPAMQQGQGVQTYPQVQQPAQGQQTAYGGFICRPVTCREEAVAAQTEYFSAGLIMPDLGHWMVYIKRFNQNTGASDFLEFGYVPPKTNMENSPQWVSVDAFNALVKKVEQLESKSTTTLKKQKESE